MIGGLVCLVVFCFSLTVGPFLFFYPLFTLFFFLFFFFFPLYTCRNPSLKQQLFSYAILGFALSEAMGLFCLMVAFLILFAM